MTYYTVVLPFSGFYGTSHSDTIDYYVDDEVESGSLSNLDDVNYGLVHRLYAAHYARELCDVLGLPHPVKTELRSPQFYNFETDKIICDIDSDSLESLIHTRINWPDFAKIVRDECTSRSGFISFTPADVDDWGECGTWTPAQWGLALQVALDVATDGRADDWECCESMESALCNGLLSDWVYSSLREGVTAP